MDSDSVRSKMAEEMGWHKLRWLSANLATCLWLSPVDAQELSFSLPDLDGKPIKLQKQDDRRLTVVCFLGTQCPLAKLYASRLNQFAAEFTDVQFIGVCSNLQDSLEDLRTFRDKHQFRFPLVKDRDNIVADQFQAQRTPEVFLLDHELIVRYHGRIDDQYQPGIAKSEPRRHDLRIAINECLVHKPVSVATTEPAGASRDTGRYLSVSKQACRQFVQNIRISLSSWTANRFGDGKTSIRSWLIW